MKNRIEQQLKANLSLDYIEVIDESHLHGGHNHFDGSPGSHFRIIIKAQSLTDLSKVKAHKTIYQILKEEMDIIHALAIELK
ncbi:MAG: BolA family transcriptional regulator [Rickettsiales bacterium]|jgi:BolA family transcriptional regulator, general stress-responsive regulator|nr:BolA family transcriptional regulator [Rickettsiales bacterium]